MNLLRRHPEIVVYSVVAWALWLVPVFDRLHVESGAVVAAVAFFTAGLRALGSMRFREASFPTDGARPSGLRFRAWYPFAYPLIAAFWLTVSVLWAPNCDYPRGALLFATFVFPGVALGLALARLIRDRAAGRRWLFVAIGGLILLAGPLYDLGLHPQFYTYNHVFGGVLGPIYDDELVVRPGVFLFRLFTLVWAGLLVCLADGRWRWAAGASLLLLAGYSQAGPLGINTPPSYMEQSFTGRVSGDGYELYYYTGQTTDSLVQVMRDELDWQMHRLDSLLHVRPSRPVRVYAWPSADERARQTGARYTSVAPVWLHEPQIHVVADQLTRFASHELVHVFSREFGLPVVRASSMAGLVEGLAVAFESPRGTAPANHLVAAAYGQNGELDRQLARALTPAGFWSGRGAVSYTTTGAFVAWLARTYGVERLTQVYARADFEHVYGRDVLDLAAEWQRSLTALPVLARSAGGEARRSFSRPSLFEQQCPHYVPPRVRALRRALADGSLEGLESVVARWPDYTPANYALAGAHVPVESSLEPDPAGHARELRVVGGGAAEVRRLLRAIPAPSRSAYWFELAAWVGEPDRVVAFAGEALRRTPLSARRDRARRGELLEAVGGHVTSGPQAEINAYKKWAQSRMFYTAGDFDSARERVRESRFLYAGMGDVAMIPVLDEWMQRIAWRQSADRR